MLRVPQKLADQILLILLNSVPDTADAIINDVQYHLKCWVLAQKTASQVTSADSKIQEMEDLKKCLQETDE